MSEPGAFVGLDIGGTNLRALGFAPDGKTLAEESAPTSDDGTGAWLERARAVVRRAVARCPADAVVGVAAPGLPEIGRAHV